MALAVDRQNWYRLSRILAHHVGCIDVALWVTSSIVVSAFQSDRFTVDQTSNLGVGADDLRCGPHYGFPSALKLCEAWMKSIIVTYHLAANRATAVVP